MGQCYSQVISSNNAFQHKRGFLLSTAVERACGMQKACVPANAFLTDHKEEWKDGSQLDLKPHSSESLASRRKAGAHLPAASLPLCMYMSVYREAYCRVSIFVRQRVQLVHYPLGPHTKPALSNTTHTQAKTPPKHKHHNKKIRAKIYWHTDSKVNKKSGKT